MRFSLVILVISCSLLRLSSGFSLHQAMRWLHQAGFYDHDMDGSEGMDDVEVAQAIAAPLHRMKTWFGLGDDALLDDQTKTLMEQPRCANPDVDPESSGRSKRWTRLGNQVWKERPVTFGFKNYWNGPMSRELQEDVARGCARKWADVSGLSFRFVRNQVANIYIEFAPIEGDAGKYGVIGVASSPVPFGNPASSYVKMDSREDWRPRKSSGGQGPILEEGLCHEMGHALGLGHSTVRAAVMFPSIGQQSGDVKLDADDVRGIQALYGGSNGQTLIGDKDPEPNIKPQTKSQQPEPSRPSTRQPTRPPTSRPNRPTKTTKSSNPRPTGRRPIRRRRPSTRPTQRQPTRSRPVTRRRNFFGRPFCNWC